MALDSQSGIGLEYCRGNEMPFVIRVMVFIFSRRLQCAKAIIRILMISQSGPISDYVFHNWILACKICLLLLVLPNQLCSDFFLWFIKTTFYLSACRYCRPEQGIQVKGITLRIRKLSVRPMIRYPYLTI